MNNSRGFISLGLVLAIVIGIAVLGGAGYFATQQTQKETETATTTTTSAPMAREGVDENKDTLENNGFRASTRSGSAPLTVTFDVPPSAGNLSVDFGDGSSMTTACPETSPVCGTYTMNTDGGIRTTHTYTSPGTYTATASRHLPTTQIGSVQITVQGVGTKTYRSWIYGFEYTYRGDWIVKEGGTSYESNVVTIAAFGPDKEGEFVNTKISLWKEFPDYGPVTSVEELKKAVTTLWGPKAKSEVPYSVSIVERGGFTFVILKGMPGLVGSMPYAFTLVKHGILVIYAGDVDRIKKFDVFIATPLSGKVPLAVTFDVQRPSSNLSIDFGDGSAPVASGCAGECPQTWRLSHTYAAPGTYTARLMETCGNTASCTAQKWEAGTATITVK